MLIFIYCLHQLTTKPTPAYPYPADDRKNVEFGNPGDNLSKFNAKNIKIIIKYNSTSFVKKITYKGKQYSDDLFREVVHKILHFAKSANLSYTNFLSKNSNILLKMDKSTKTPKSFNGSIGILVKKGHREAKNTKTVTPLQISINSTLCFMVSKGNFSVAMDVSNS